jgi:hypothetical protein
MKKIKPRHGVDCGPHQRFEKQVNLKMKKSCHVEGKSTASIAYRHFRTEVRPIENTERDWLMLGGSPLSSCTSVGSDFANPILPILKRIWRASAPSILTNSSTVRVEWPIVLATCLVHLLHSQFKR